MGAEGGWHALNGNSGKVGNSESFLSDGTHRRQCHQGFLDSLEPA